MNTQKQISVMVALVFLLLGGCAAYTVYDQPRENSALDSQQANLAERGARIFARYCRQCHGNAGEGRIGPALNRPELRDPAHLTENTQWITDTITCGRIGKIMPPWAIREGGALNDEQIKDLVTLITTNGEPKINGWQRAGEFSAVENQAAPVPPVADVLAAAAITGGGTSRVCGQLAATPAAEETSGALPSGLTPANAWTENATDNKFDVTAMAVTSGTGATVTFNNKGAAIHNWEVLDTGGKVLNGADSKPVSVPLTDGGKSSNVTFTISTPGVYTFRCQVHPTEMLGKLYVVGPDGTAGGAGGAGAAAAAPPAAQTAWTENATDNKFDVTAMAATASAATTVTFNNKGSAIHNWEVLDSGGSKVLVGADGKPISLPLTDAGKSASITFTIASPGTYTFRCQVHPTEMLGKLTVVAGNK
jgi:plastocyanin/mono/diheme cytochrome c family protein